MKISEFSFETIKISPYKGWGEEVTLLELNRPQVRNALNDKMIEEISHALLLLSQEKNLRVLIFQGKENYFCAGADLHWMRKAVSFSYEENLKDAQALGRLFNLLQECPIPTVALLEGGCFGGGVGFVATCDVALAKEDTMFSLSEVRLGLIPAVISPYISHAMGMRRAQKLSLTGERFTAVKAQEWGLVTEIATSENWDKQIEKLLKELLLGGPHAQKAAKKLFRDLRESKKDELFELTTQTIASLRVSQEGQEGLAAFLEKRPPAWGVA